MSRNETNRDASGINPNSEIWNLVLVVVLVLGALGFRDRKETDRSYFVLLV